MLSSVFSHDKYVNVQVMNIYKCDCTDISWGERGNVLFNEAMPR